MDMKKIIILIWYRSSNRFSDNVVYLWFFAAYIKVQLLLCDHHHFKFWFYRCLHLYNI